MSRSRRWDKARHGYGGFDETTARDWRVGPNEVDTLSIIPSDVRPVTVPSKKSNGLFGLKKRPDPIFSETIDYKIECLGDQFWSTAHEIGIGRALEYYFGIKPPAPKISDDFPLLEDCVAPKLYKRHEIKKNLSGGCNPHKRARLRKFNGK